MRALPLIRLFRIAAVCRSDNIYLTLFIHPPLASIPLRINIGFCLVFRRVLGAPLPVPLPKQLENTLQPEIHETVHRQRKADQAKYRFRGSAAVRIGCRDGLCICYQVSFHPFVFNRRGFSLVCNFIFKRIVWKDVWFWSKYWISILNVHLNIDFICKYCMCMFWKYIL